MWHSGNFKIIRALAKRLFMNFDLFFPALGLACFGLNIIAWRAFDAGQPLHAKTGERLAALQWLLATVTICVNVLILLDKLPSVWLSVFVGIFLSVQYGASAWLHFARRSSGVSTNA